MGKRLFLKLILTSIFFTTGCGIDFPDFGGDDDDDCNPDQATVDKCDAERAACEEPIDPAYNTCLNKCSGKPAEEQCGNSCADAKEDQYENCEIMHFYCLCPGQEFPGHNN